MPPKKGSIEARNADLRKMDGTAFAMEVSRDLLLLPKDERAKALRMLTALNDTINRETEATAAPPGAAK